MGDFAGALAPFIERPAHAGVFCDFDGTLSPIVTDPAMAAPAEGIGALLAELADRYGVVGVLSGRPLGFVRAFFPPPVVVAGLYGLEVSDRDGLHEHPHAGAWRETVADVAAVLRERVPHGVIVEHKGVSLTLHYRSTPEAEATVRLLAEAQARRAGLEVREARQSIELHPPIPTDKGTALTDLTTGLGAVCFVGDDAGDLPAFDALDDLALAGVATLRVAVRSTEAPDELVARADLVLTGTDEVVAFLEALRGSPAPPAP